MILAQAGAGHAWRRRMRLAAGAAVLAWTATGAPAQDEYLRAFTERHFAGEQDVYTPLQDVDHLRRMGGRISSVIYKIQPGRVCALFVDRDFRGPSLELHGTGEPVRLADLGLYTRNVHSLRWDITRGEVQGPEGAMVRLYEGESFRDRRLTLAFNQNIPNLRQAQSDDGRAGFETLVTSVRWLVPPGWNCVLYVGRDYRDDALELRGTGHMESISHLERHARKVSSVRWEQARPIKNPLPP